MGTTNIVLFSVLDPAQKANHIRTYWGEDLLKQPLRHAEDIVSYLSHPYSKLTALIIIFLVQGTL